MQASYLKNYLKIYFYQALSIILGFSSLFVVVPYLSEDQAVYGIYTVCMSVTIFLSYADLGFLGAGMKYAAESFSKDDRLTEMKLIGFSHFILLIFVIIISSSFLFISYKPELLIRGISEGRERYTAHYLLLILAIFSPTIILQRTLQMIFGIRLQDFLLQRINIVGNLVKILSVFYFFGFGNYQIVSYFLFVQIINVVCAILGVLQAKRRFNYNFCVLLKHIKFSSEIYNKTKSLAYSSLFVTVSWILYYELDSFAIGSLLGAKEVATYAIGLTILSFFRTLLGVLFSPFSARFNHFIGTGSSVQLKEFYFNVISITLPLVIFPIISIVLCAEALVVSWVGWEYRHSITIVRWLVLCNVLAFISYPAGMLMIAQEKLKEMYFVSIIMPVIYWTGILLTIDTLGVQSFAIFKFIAFFISGVIYFWFTIKYLDMRIWDYLKSNIIPYVPSVLTLCILLYLCNSIYIDGKNKINLLRNCFIMSMGIGISMALSILSVKSLKNYLKEFRKKFKFRNG